MPVLVVPQLGMQQQFELGQYIRKRYGGFLSATYKPEEVSVQIYIFRKFLFVHVYPKVLREVYTDPPPLILSSQQLCEVANAQEASWLGRDLNLDLPCLSPTSKPLYQGSPKYSPGAKPGS